MTSTRLSQPDNTRSSSVATMTREFAIPFLGSLVPGTYLWMGILFSIIPPISFLIGSFTAQGGTSFNLLTYLSTMVQNIKSGSWILFLVISYVLGAILSKQNVAVTNRESFRRISKKIASERKDLAGVLACSSVENCDYPYPDLYSYFEKRGFTHLLGYISWKDKPDLKSKAFVNRLKIEIELSSPGAYQNIVRNESHIRLASTVWHSSRLIRYCAVFGIALVLISFAIVLLGSNSGKPLSDNLRISISTVCFPLFVLMLSEYIRINIEKIFHYQRLRELLYILETHYQVSDPGNKRK